MLGIKLSNPSMDRSANIIRHFTPNKAYPFVLDTNCPIQLTIVVNNIGEKIAFCDTLIRKHFKCVLLTQEEIDEVKGNGKIKKRFIGN